MKLVTFDDGRVGRLDDETVVELACASMRPTLPSSNVTSFIATPQLVSWIHFS